MNQHGLHGSFPSITSSSVITRIEREMSPSGHCFLERQFQQSSNGNERSDKQTESKICGEKYHTTVKQNGQILRQYGNATLEELDRIDASTTSDNDRATDATSIYSDFFKKLFSWMWFVHRIKCVVHCSLPIWSLWADRSVDKQCQRYLSVRCKDRVRTREEKQDH